MSYTEQTTSKLLGRIHMSIFSAIFQAVLQGITEFLPVSSSGHLSIFQHFLGIGGQEGLAYAVFLHFGTLIAVIIAFYKAIWELLREVAKMIKDLFTGKFIFKLSQMNENRRMIIMLFISTAMLILFYPVKGFFESFGTDKSIMAEGFFLMFTGGLLLLADKVQKGTKTAKDMKTKDAIAIGLMQGVALLPGVSRSGSTISTGLIFGLSRQFAVKFSFLMSIPVVLVAVASEIKDVAITNTDTSMLLILFGIAIAAVIGFFAIRLIQWLVKTDKFAVFAYYCLIVGALVVAESFYENILGKTIFQTIGIL
jgi:undecaprenyl-diphosphatase